MPDHGQYVKQVTQDSLHKGYLVEPDADYTTMQTAP
jgi:hypothetical protein